MSAEGNYSVLKLGMSTSLLGQLFSLHLQLVRAGDRESGLLDSILGSTTDLLGDLGHAISPLKSCLPTKKMHRLFPL